MTGSGEIYQSAKTYELSKHADNLREASSHVDLAGHDDDMARYCDGYVQRAAARGRHLSAYARHRDICLGKRDAHLQMATAKQLVERASSLNPSPSSSALLAPDKLSRDDQVQSI